MEMVNVNSEAVQAIGYDGSTLYLQWRSGKTSEHPGVPVEKYHALMAAESKGKHIARHIKPQYPAR